MARTATISPNPASRAWRGRCGRRWRSIRAPPARSHPRRGSSAAESVRRRGFMPVYTVHAPVAGGAESSNATDRFVLVRDGFHFWAFLLGPLWLAGHRLWLALLGYLVIIAAGQAALSQLNSGAGARVAVMLLIALLTGLEAASLRRWTLSRRKWRQLDIVVADDEDA